MGEKDSYEQILADAETDAEDYCEARGIVVPFHMRHDEALAATEAAVRRDLVRRARAEADASFVTRNLAGDAATGRS